MTDVQPATLRDCAGFGRFWTAATVSGFGTYVTSLAIQVLVVVTLHEGAAGVGLVNAARWIPYLLFGLVVGVLVDRARRRPLLVATDLIRAALLVAVPVLSLTHHLTLVLLMVFMAVFGLMSLVGDAAAQSFLPRLVPVRLLAPANARLDQSDSVAQTSGPALAGGLVSLFSAPFAVLVDAVSYLVSGLLLVRIPVEEPPSQPVSLRGVRGDAAEGLRWIYGQPGLRAAAIGAHGWFLCNAIAGAVLPPLALRTLGLSAFAYGLTLAAGGVGGLLGATVSTRLGSRFGTGRVVVVCTLGSGLGWAVVALCPVHLGVLVLAAGEFVLGLAIGASNANEMGYRQAITPDALQGRTNATIRSINRAMIVVGAPLGGLLADVVGLRVMLWVAAVGFALIAAWQRTTAFHAVRLADV